MKKLKIIILISAISLVTENVISQGCSDAGLCTMGTLKPATPADSAFRSNTGISLSFGSGEQGVTIFQIIPEVDFSFFKNNNFQVKLPYTIASGNLGDNQGVGDLALSVSQRLLHRNHTGISVTIGAKLPTGTTDETGNYAYSLPMPYQTGLGTTDLVLGAGLYHKSWNISAGYQRVLHHANDNTFLRNHFAGDSDAAAYFESNFLERGDDLLLRLEKRFLIKKLMLTPGILSIYRLTEDQISDNSGKHFAVNGSDGLTLNITGTILYPVTERIDLNLVLAAPAVVRETRPDGLTRSMVITLGCRYNFNFKI